MRLAKTGARSKPAPADGPPAPRPLTRDLTHTKFTAYITGT